MGWFGHAATPAARDSLTGTDMLADDQQMLRSVTFSSTSSHPTIYLTSTWFTFNPNRFLKIRARHLERIVVIAPRAHAVTGRATRIAAKRNAARRQRTPAITNAGR